MPKFALSSPVFMKITGVDEFYLPKVNEFLKRDDIRSRQPVFAGAEDLGKLPFIKLTGSKLDEDFGTYTLDFKVHPYFRSWTTSQDDFLKRSCPMKVIDDFFYLNFHYFENPT